MSLLPTRTLPENWDDPLFSAAQAQLLIRQPGYFLFNLSGAHLLACVMPHANADILTLYTQPTARRQGLAGQLLNALMRQAQAAQSPAITLEVRASNAPAIALYRRHGFVHLTTRRNYYSHPTEDAHVYSLALHE